MESEGKVKGEIGSNAKSSETTDETKENHESSVGENEPKGGEEEVKGEVGIVSQVKEENDSQAEPTEKPTEKSDEPTIDNDVVQNAQPLETQPDLTKTDSGDSDPKPTESSNLPITSNEIESPQETTSTSND